MVAVWHLNFHVDFCLTLRVCRLLAGCPSLPSHDQLCKSPQVISHHGCPPWQPCIVQTGGHLLMWPEGQFVANNHCNRPCTIPGAFRLWRPLSLDFNGCVWLLLVCVCATHGLSSHIIIYHFIHLHLWLCVDTFFHLSLRETHSTIFFIHQDWFIGKSARSVCLEWKTFSFIFCSHHHNFVIIV